jgi:hypothetical protein
MSTYQYYRNLEVDKAIFKLDKNNFDFAIRVNYLPGTPAI